MDRGVKVSFARTPLPGGEFNLRVQFTSPRNMPAELMTVRERPLDLQGVRPAPVFVRMATYADVVSLATSATSTESLYRASLLDMAVSDIDTLTRLQTGIVAAAAALKSSLDALDGAPVAQTVSIGTPA